MILRKFITGVVIRLVLMFGIMMALAYFFLDPLFVFTQLVLLGLLILILTEFFRYITKTNRDLSKFIFAIRHEDYSVSFSGYKLGNAFNELHDSFREMLDIYRSNRLEKEDQFQLLQTIMNKLPIGLIACEDTGNVILINESANKLLGVNGISKLERLDKFQPGLSQRLMELPLEVLLEVNELQVLRSHISGKTTLHLFVIQSLKHTSDDTEMDAWLKLIRVLTHEIMNSITSVSSLSETAIQLNVNSGSKASIDEALQSINKRTKNMIGFVEDYRKLSNVPAPRRQWFKLSEAITSQLELLANQLKGIEVQLCGETDLQIHADRAQSEQVMLNVLLNTIHALEGIQNPQISITIEKRGRNTLLHIQDNGKGISAEDLNQVFIPFFTTREKGSGIGLSLNRQIMRNHGGSIAIQSRSGEGTKVSLRFSDY